ncbi:MULTISPECIES: hypothetical protein [Natrialba]|uniref:DUF8149 domain-containing protein n=2 Tax=Natrialba TaxID=63742 RepID=M0ASL4_NATA1|nr:MULTISPECIES: hypothetical protein [Natrialba]ELY85289.1 hypothetical protein C484_20652 [Natrialba taiwanensis DSM 12281]ELZ00374.1 hypothetical protein C481_12029 [Natrialba asiatica DSM 12278]
MTSDDTDTDADSPRVPIVCDACETTSRVPLSAVADAVERHNTQLHDGEAVAEVDPDIADRIADLVATELGLLDETE